MKTKIKIICPFHGVFEQTPKNHIKGQNCPNCPKKIISIGEKKISEILRKNNIKYNNQHTFENCRDKRKLPFDFYLPYYNMCIEFDGRQHFESVINFGGEEQLKKTQQNDKIKNKYCKENNIKLLRIKYTENIEEKLSFL